MTSQHAWTHLTQAYHLLTQARVTEALDMYAEIVKGQAERYFYLAPAEGGWEVCADPAQPSLDWAAVYLGSYCLIQREYCVEWLKIAQHLSALPAYPQFSASARSRLSSLTGWAQIIGGGTPLTAVIQSQLHDLKTLPTNPLEKNLHEMTLGLAYQRLRKHDQAIGYLRGAHAALRFETEPFFYLQAQESIASAYHFLNDQDPTYWEKAMHLYKQMQAMAYQALPRPEYYHQGYNLGWAYAEQGKYEEAYDYFQEGYHVARRLKNERLKGLCQYGQGFVLLQTGEYALALDLLHEAADKFYYLRLDLMTAVALNLLSLTYDRLDQPVQALDYSLRAYEAQRLVDNPVQRLHIVQQLTHVSWRLRHWRRWLRYLPEFYYLKIRLGK